MSDGRGAFLGGRCQTNAGLLKDRNGRNGHRNGHAGKPYWPAQRRRRRWLWAVAAFAAATIVALIGYGRWRRSDRAAPARTAIVGPGERGISGSPMLVAVMQGDPSRPRAASGSPATTATPASRPATAATTSAESSPGWRPAPRAVPGTAATPTPMPAVDTTFAPRPAPAPLAPPLAPTPGRGPIAPFPVENAAPAPVAYPAHDDPRWAAVAKQMKWLERDDGFGTKDYYEKVLTEIEEVIQTSSAADEGHDVPPRELTCQFIQALDEGEKRRVWLPPGQGIDHLLPKMRDLRRGLLMRLLPQDRASLGTVDGFHCFRG